MCTGNREDSQSISKYVHGQVSQYTQFLNVTEIGPDAYGIKSGRVPIYKAARVCSARGGADLYRLNTDVWLEYL